MLRRTIYRCTLTAFALAAPFSVMAQRGPGGGPGGGGGMGGPRGPAGSMGPSGSGSPMGGGMGHRGSTSSFGPRRSPALGPPGRWWDDRRLVHSLNLRADQQKRMDGIFDANRQGLAQLYANLQREQGKLNSMSSADVADESKLFAAIDRVTQARAELQKASTHVMLQIRRELDATQLAALDRETSSSQ
jgi:Spy/CpxP family protein refolding chaperone